MKRNELKPHKVRILLLLASLMLALFPAAGCRRKADAETGRAPAEWTPAVWEEYTANGPTGDRLPDFSRAGYRMGEASIPDIQGPLFDVTADRFGAVPDDGKEDTAAIQAAVNAAATAGGGVVYLPRGRYEVRTTADAPFLQIAADRIVLRGKGDGDSGTILFMGAPGKDGSIRRLGTVPAEKEARRQAAVAIIGPEARKELAAFTGDVVRGQTDIPVSDSSAFTEGQMVIVECTDPLVDPENPSPDKADIAARLTAPFRLTEAQPDTYGKAARKLSWIAGIEKIIDGRTIRLTRPARFDQPLRYAPKIYSFGGVREIGIEHLRIESAWPGGYRHHKPFEDADGNVLRSAREQDYLWGGIWISSSVNGWVRDVTFRNMTQGIILSTSSQWTLEDLTFLGQEGHAGVTIGWGNDNLIARADFIARMVHPITLELTASGNVATDCEARYEGRNPVSATDAAMDFHGIFPYENLFEKMRGFYVCPGGDLSVLPHAGVRNVFWNIEAPARIDGYGDRPGDSFVQVFDHASTTSKTAATMYEHFPRAFYIGITRRENRIVTIGDSAGDRKNEWMTVEGLNRPAIAVPSLYEAQKHRRHAGAEATDETQ